MDRHAVLMHFFDITHFCAVARCSYSQDDGELASQPVHMLMPWFSARSRSNVGHNPVCVSLSAQSSGMTELEGNMAEHSARRAEQWPWNFAQYTCLDAGVCFSTCYF